MDFDASLLLDGKVKVDELAVMLAEYVAKICAGKKTKAEILGHAEYFIPYKYQDKTVVMDKSCKF